MLLIILLLVIGFAMLIFGGDFLVNGASSIARSLKISPLVIGLTIVAFGTSAPELIVNILSAINNSPDLAIGNVVGSNIANVMLILGIAAMIYPLKVGGGTVWKEIPLSLLAAIMLFFVANDSLIDKVDQSIISRIDGFVLIGFFLIFLYYTFGIAKVEGKDGEDYPKYPLWRSTIYIVMGIGLLAYGGNLVVDNAVAISRYLGLGENIIGLTIVAIGTSLPELVTSVTAALKRQNDIAIGNVVGSNIFNIFWILGISSVIRGLPFNEAGNVDLAVMLASGLLLFFFMFNGKKHQIDRWQGVLFVLLYIGYTTYLVAGNT